DFVESIYAGTKVTNKEERMKMFGMAKKDLMALNDPMIEFASKLEAERKELEEKTDAFGGAVERLRPQLMEVRRAYGGELLYPDANGTMRLSIGKVAGYKPRDAVTYYHETTLKGVIEKHTGQPPFNCPDALKDLYENKDFGNYADKTVNDVPVCLLTTNDSTGGNSGSPIMNGKGEVIGTLFDGNYEAMASDMFFIPDLTRSIHCDSRYILFIVDKFAGAEELLNELTVHGGGSL
ncbi:MAG: S46 family peptidase, partial [Candidatus Latescibacterota bacterium]